MSPKPPPQHLFLPYLPETLPMHTIYAPLKGQPYLAHLERYFSAANDNNFYILLEEWNAYNAGLNLAVAFFGVCPTFYTRRYAVLFWI